MTLRERSQKRRHREDPVLKTSYVFNQCQLEGYVPEAEEMLNNKPLLERLATVDQFVGNTRAYIMHGVNRS